jgi:hypothetical protein
VVCLMRGALIVHRPFLQHARSHHGVRQAGCENESEERPPARGQTKGVARGGDALTLRLVHESSWSCH